MIRKATYKDIDSILKITRTCALFMTNQGVFQWNENYPSKKAFENDVLRDELYVLETNSKIIGCIVVSTFMDKEYIPIKWLIPNSNNIYIHRLAVHPEQQGKGYARKLMNFAETLAKNNHFVSIRLDTFSKNVRNQKFYELRNYKRLGEIYFPNQSESPFYCYELVL
ncbi:GNAT family N-acetyltransferase [Xanthomarina sp. F1114]|uniref:GNAT family N-acetyltransferase n=1 Tax=Xanthomarina sp. F1114 TaxID=2996019 RepID=UPI00225E03FD|nr:GNAT family N-acetyltransferase [Xanthomarina sp. F1114]MCX7546504.1 GNAT family N-acetyltransferase [Xanthomarina sp. F1114]